MKEDFQENKRKTIPRRKFINNITIAAAVLLLPKISNFRSEENKESDLQEFAWMDQLQISPELKDIPELLQGYFKDNPIWSKIAKDQRDRVRKFANSYTYVDRLKSQFKEKFKYKTAQEVSVLTQNLFYIRVSNLNNNDVVFKRLKDGVKGKYTPGKPGIPVDTANAGPFVDGEGNHIEKWELFTVAHECEHTTQSHDLMFYGVFELIIDSMVENNALDKSIAQKIKDEVINKSKKEDIYDEGRVNIEDEDEFELNYYSQRPSEAMSYMMQVRVALDIVSQYYPDKVKFDMSKDEFNQEHLNFLKENQYKIFQSMTLPKRNLENVTVFSALLMHFGERKLIELMNKV